MNDSLQHFNTPWGNFSFAPQNDLEATIIQDTTWQQGLFFGKPRRGHPEGQIWPHILEVMQNVEALRDSQSEEVVTKLRLITLIHDSFKYQVNPRKPNIGSNHHAWIARSFAERYIQDKAILEILELHDEAYYAWRLGGWHQDWLSARYRLDQLLRRVDKFALLYYLFFKCDTQTGDKDQTPLIWFEEEVQQHLQLVIP